MVLAPPIRGIPAPQTTILSGQQIAGELQVAIFHEHMTNRRQTMTKTELRYHPNAAEHAHKYCRMMRGSVNLA